MSIRDPDHGEVEHAHFRRTPVPCVAMLVRFDRNDALCTNVQPFADEVLLEHPPRIAIHVVLFDFVDPRKRPAGFRSWRGIVAHVPISLLPLANIILPL